jgi:hypothetical protein
MQIVEHRLVDLDHIHLIHNIKMSEICLHSNELEELRLSIYHTG